MKVLIVTTSRADWNGLGMVARELIRREIGVWTCAYSNTAPDWGEAIFQDVRWHDYGNGALDRCVIEYTPDVAVVAGDRSELLEACITLCKYKVPICHIGGGDITEGSMDDRYRDAITALACIHCAETEQAVRRLSGGRHPRFRDDAGFCGDAVYLTGQPGLDRIKQTVPVQPPIATFINPHRPNVLLIVHPNTTQRDPALECNAIIAALKEFDHINVLPLEPNKDPGNELITARLFGAFGKVISNRPPAEFYWLLQHCDVLVGNSSAGTAEAPCFGIPVVNVGDRQKGRAFGPCTWLVPSTPDEVRMALNEALRIGRCKAWDSPYGDGESAPRIVKVLEDNAWRWSSKTAEVSHVKQREPFVGCSPMASDFGDPRDPETGRKLRRWVERNM